MSVFRFSFDRNNQAMKKTASVFLLLSLICCQNEKTTSPVDENIVETEEYILTERSVP